MGECGGKDWRGSVWLLADDEGCSDEEGREKKRKGDVEDKERQGKKDTVFGYFESFDN